jgi:DUF2934 family protein
MNDNGNMSTPRRRRKDREPLNQLAGTPAPVPNAMGKVPKWIETLAIEPSHEDIARRAYQLHEEHGGEHGHDQDDWFQAEREMRHVLHDLADRMLMGDSYAAA